MLGQQYINRKDREQFPVFSVYILHRSIVTLKPMPILLLLMTTTFVYTLGLSRIIIDQVYTFPLLSKRQKINIEAWQNQPLY